MNFSSSSKIKIRTRGINSGSSPMSVSNPMSSSSRVKMKIKPFKKPPAPPSDLYDRTFSLLISATQAILRKQPLVIESIPSSAPTAARESRPMAAGGIVHRSESPTSVSVTPVTTHTPGLEHTNTMTTSVPISKEELYQSVVDLCVHGYSNRLYNDVCNVLETGALYCLQKLTNDKSDTWAPGAVALDSNVVFYRSNSTTTTDSSSLRILNCVREVYSYFLEYLTFVRSIFLYLDRTYVLGKTKVKSLWDVGIDTFRRHAMFNNDPTKYSTLVEMVISACLHQIKCEREGEVVDRVLLRSTIRMLADLQGCFQSQFIPRFIAESIAYFQKEGDDWMISSTNSHSGTASEFLAHVEKRWTQANDMSLYYLDCAAARMKNDESSKNILEKFSLKGKETTMLLASVVEQYLLLPHVESFLLQQKHLYPLLDDDTKLIPDLKRLYILLRKVSKLNELRTAFGTYGRMTGIKIIQGSSSNVKNSNDSNSSSSNKESDRDIVPNLLKWKERLETIHRVGFMNDETFGFSTTSHSITSTSNNNQLNPQSDLGNSSHPTSTVSCLRGVLGDVLNGSSLENSKSHDAGDYSKRVAELFAKHVDLCLRSAKALAMPSNSIPANLNPIHPPAAKSAAPFSNSTFNQLNPMYGAESFTKPNESDPEHLLSKIMSMFRHLQSKDVFEAFYKRDLAKRLLTNKSASIDLERSFISKLKTECGTSYTAKMEGMFKDMDLSREVMSHYFNENAALQAKKSKKINNEQQEVEMDVQILTTGYWPVYQQSETIKLPPPLLAPLTSFETHYRNKYQGRRIVWQHSLGSCIVKAYFPHGTKDLVLSQYQTLVLVLCFNDCEDLQDERDLGKGLTISEIMAQTGIEDRGECERVLQSLSVGRDGTRVLIKRDPNMPVPTKSSKKRTKAPKERKAVAATDTFHYNHNFTSRQVRIRITSIQMKESAQERDDTHQTVSRHRVFLIDAAIVRIMKARKTISHQALLGEVMNQLRFPATSADIKKRVGVLIDREYMERSSESRDKYNYLA